MTTTALPTLVFDQPPATTREVDDICQRGVEAALSYIAAGRPERAKFVLWRTEMDARRRQLDLQAQALERAAAVDDPEMARFHAVLREGGVSLR